MKKHLNIGVSLILLIIIVVYILSSRTPSPSEVPEDEVPEQTTQTNTSTPTPEIEDEESYVVDPSDFLDTQVSSGEDAPQQLTQQEIDDLLMMREEEKLARDVYDYLYEKWNKQIFTNIAKSEQTHTEAMRSLLDYYDIEDPVTDDAMGAFSSQQFSSLYNELTTMGDQSLGAAIRVGALIEDLDIFDLSQAMANTTQSNIISVYKNLQKGSRNHLRAFNKQLIRETGESYEAQHVTQEEIDNILASPQEKGRTQ